MLLTQGQFGVGADIYILGVFVRFHAHLFRSVAMVATPAVDFAADRAAASAQDLSNLRERLIRFYKAVDLVSFYLAEVLV